MGVAAERHPRDCEMTRVIDHRLAAAAVATVVTPKVQKGRRRSDNDLGQAEDRPDMMKVPDKSLVLRTHFLLYWDFELNRD